MQMFLLLVSDFFALGLPKCAAFAEWQNLRKGAAKHQETLCEGSVLLTLGICSWPDIGCSCMNTHRQRGVEDLDFVKEVLSTTGVSVWYGDPCLSVLVVPDGASWTGKTTGLDGATVLRS